MSERKLRAVDRLGRVVLPIQMRRTFDIKERDDIEIYMDGEQIVLSKHEPVCTICGLPTSRKFKGKHICIHCREELVRYKYPGR